MSDEVANTILYLIEQRRYCGTDVHVGTLLWSGIHASSKERLRAAPIFHLTQKTAGMNFNGQYWGQGALQAQFGVEASGYYIESFEYKKNLLRKEYFLRTADQMTKFSFRIGINSPENSKARKYASLAFNERKSILWDPLDPNKSLEFVTKALETGRLSQQNVMRGITFIARIHAYSYGDPEQSLNTYRELIDGKYKNLDKAFYALSEYSRILKRFPESSEAFEKEVYSYFKQGIISHNEYNLLINKIPN